MFEAPCRRERRAQGRTRVTRRDLEVLLFIGRAQPVVTSQVEMVLGSSTAIARRRLRVLRDHGLVRVEVPEMAGQNVYLVTEKGREALLDAVGAEAERVRVLRGVGRQLDHHLPSVSMYAALLIATRSSRTLRLEDYEMERDIRARLGVHGKNQFVSDATAVLSTDEGARFSVAIEVDLGTEKNPDWVMEVKGRAYTQAHESGRPLSGAGTWAVLFLVPSERRMLRLVRAAWKAELPLGLFWFAKTPDLSPGAVLSDAPWRTLRLDADGEHVRLVAESPFATLASSAARSAGSGPRIPDASGVPM